MTMTEEAMTEAVRLEALRALDVLDTPPESEFNAIVAGARHLFECKFAFISLIDADRQWFKAKAGLKVTETPLQISFCTHAVSADNLLVVPDAREDLRFAANPLVTGEPHIRFYAGVPLRVKATTACKRVPVGTLCVADDQPHAPAADKLEMLCGMAHVIEALLEARRTSRESLRLALDRDEALDAMARMHRLLQHAERMARIGSWRLELVSGQVHWSDQTYAIHGIAPGSEALLERALGFYPSDDRAKLEAALALCIDQGTPWDLELNFTDAQGHARRVRTLGELDQGAGKGIAITGVIQDITDRYRFERGLLAAARTDELTGIPSRRAFNEELEVALNSPRGAEPPVLAIIDLDHFKEVNDRLGHAAGDEVLRTMAAKLRSAQYLGDYFIARLGGDEFVLLLRGPRPPGQLERDIECLLTDLRCSVPAGGGTIHVSATIGVCAYGGRYVDRSALLTEADEALYRAKRRQRGTGVIAGSNVLIKGLPDDRRGHGQG